MNNLLGVNETCEGYESNELAHEINAIFSDYTTAEMPVESDYDSADYSTERPWKRIYEEKSNPMDFLKMCGLNFVVLYRVKGDDEWHEEGYYPTKEHAKECAWSMLFTGMDFVIESKIEAL